MGKLASCDGKVGFESYKRANKTLKRSRASNLNGNVYWCIKCKLFHIGTSILRRVSKKKLLKEFFNMQELLSERKDYGRGLD
jgi:hypothetical protein